MNRHLLCVSWTSATGTLGGERGKESGTVAVKELGLGVAVDSDVWIEANNLAAPGCVSWRLLGLVLT